MMRSLLLIGLVAAAALALGALLDPRGYAVRILCLVLMAASMAQAWNITGGLANQISLGHAAFFGIGAYTSTVLQTKAGVTPWLGLPAGMLLAAAAAALLALPTFRLKGHYFALATLAFAEACRALANASGFIGGPQGLSVPFAGDSLAMMQFRRAGFYVPLFVGLFVVTFTVFALFANGRLGFMLRAVRENEAAAEVAGLDTVRVKLKGALVSAALTAACGTLYAQFNFFFDPDTVFGVIGVSVRMALIAIVGGVGTLFGPLVGAIFIVLTEEGLNTALSSRGAGIAPLVFGAVLMLVVICRPAGLLSLLRPLPPLPGLARLKWGRA